MVFNQPIYGKVEGITNANAAKAYFKRHKIEYTVYFQRSFACRYSDGVEDGGYAVSSYIFKFPEITEEQLKEATKHTDVVFYQ